MEDRKTNGAAAPPMDLSKMTSSELIAEGLKRSKARPRR